MKPTVYAQQCGLFKYQLVNKDGYICNVDGTLAVYPVEFAGNAEEQLEFPVWRKEPTSPDDSD